MALPIFNAKINLSTASDISAGAMTSWDVVFTVSDAEGVFDGNSVLVNDAVAIDTTGYILDTISRYVVTSIITQTFSTVHAHITLDDPTMVGSPADLTFVTGLDGLVFRPTSSKKFSITPSESVQGLSDRFGAYLRNSDFNERVDTLSASPGGSTQDIQYNNAGALGGSDNFKIDTADGSLNLNGLRQTILASTSIAASIVSPLVLFSFSASSYPFAILEYSVVINGNYRVSRMLIANDGTVVSINGDYVETNITGLTMSADISGGNVRVLYTNSVAFTGTLKYALRRWS